MSYCFSVIFADTILGKLGFFFFLNSQNQNIKFYKPLLEFYDDCNILVIRIITSKAYMDGPVGALEPVDRDKNK